MGIADVAGALVVSVVFVGIWSWLEEPVRQRVNAIFVAGASGAYLSSGLGPWEFVFAAVVLGCAYVGLRHYRAIAVGWALHVIWDVVHHLVADPIIVFFPTSSAGCAICDAVWAVWFWLGAPSIFRR